MQSEIMINIILKWPQESFSTRIRKRVLTAHVKEETGLAPRTERSPGLPGPGTQVMLFVWFPSALSAQLPSDHFVLQACALCGPLAGVHSSQCSNPSS